MGRAYEVRKASMAKTSAAKSKVYSRFGKEIYIAAKNGVPDPESNMVLKRAIEKAKGKQVPADVIKRAIEKAKGGSTDSYDPARYEGFGPGGSTIMVDCLTDNVNRTVSEVKNCFTKTKCKMGVSGCVEHMFKHNAIVSINNLDEEAALEILLMADIDVEDVETEDDGSITVYGSPTSLYAIKETIEAEAEGSEIVEFENVWVPNDFVTLEGDDLARFDKMMAMLDECEDVQEVHHNVK